MLEIKNLKFEYNPASPVLDIKEYQFYPSKAYGLLGLNGSGKTTFFECLYQNLEYQGDILLNNNPLKKQDISYLQHAFFLYEFVLVKDFVDLIRNDENEKFISKALELFKIPLQQFTQNLSYGNKKKLMLLAVLSLERDIYILDEPFNGIDFEAVENLHEIINEIKEKGKIVIYSSHILESFAQSADYVIYLNNGDFEKTFEEPDFENIRSYYKSKIHQ